MKFAVLGGDERSVRMVRRLRQDGHEVHTFALECSALEASSPCVAEALEGAECVILPIPLRTAPGKVNAPFARETFVPEEIFSLLPKGVPVFSGAPDAQTVQAAAACGVAVTDLLSVEELAVKNAALTAEGAVGVLIREMEQCLLGTDILIVGAGRIGKLLGLRLKAMGANVTVSARRNSDCAWCRAAGLGTADTEQLELVLPRFSVVVNTVPSPVLSAARLGELPASALVLELASKPGGLDPRAADVPGIRVVSAPGLPGKTAPDSAAAAIVDTIYHLLE